MNSKIESPVRFNPYQDIMIENVLSQGVSQVFDRRWPDKALDFNRNFAIGFLGGKHAFCSQINVDIRLAPAEHHWVMRDSPTIFLKSSFDYVVI